MLSESQHYVWSGLASESVTKPQQWPTTKPQKHSSSDFTLKRSVNSTPRKSSRLHIDRFLWSSLKQHYLHKEGWTLKWQRNLQNFSWTLKKLQQNQITQNSPSSSGLIEKSSHNRGACRVNWKQSLEGLTWICLCSTLLVIHTGTWVFVNGSKQTYRWLIHTSCFIEAKQILPAVKSWQRSQLFVKD